MRKLLFLLLLLGFGAGVTIYFNQRRPAPSTAQGASSRPLVIYCAAGLKKPVEAVVAAYSKELGTEVQLQFGGTGTLLSQIRVAKTGDLFIAADDGAISDAQRFEVIKEAIPFATQTPVIAVKKGNPLAIKTLDDLLRPNVRVALANPEAASIGKITRKALGERWEALAQKATVMKPTVTEISADLSIGAVDAAIVWDSTVAQFTSLEAVAVEALNAAAEHASIGVLTACTQPVEALRFARYLSAPDRGGPVLQQHGLVPKPGDSWSAHPEVVLYSGAVNRLAVEALIQEFSAREGVTISTTYNGCGVLCAAMQAMQDSAHPRLPDAYYACDLCFVPPVAELFPEAILLTETEIGIVVPKANPRQVRTLGDLAQPGLRLGLCHTEQSTLGFMTRGILRGSPVEAAIRKNVVVEVPTADFLINQMRAGALDAAVVYKVNALAQAETLAFFPIKHPGAKAVQPFAIRKDSAYRGISARLLAHLRANQARFEQAGFTWRGNEDPVKSALIEIPPWLRPQTPSTSPIQNP